jgi:putative DNA primase/helicase
MLKGARLVICTETGQGKKMAETLVKELTGGDRITARYMRQDNFEFEATHKIFLHGNHKPHIHGTDWAIWRRIDLISFEVTIPEDERDKHLEDKLKDELSGILNWALEGCLSWQRKGLSSPDKVKTATQEYRAEQDIIGGFLADCCTINPNADETAANLYQAYIKWCTTNGEKTEAQTIFGGALKERDFEQGRTKRGGKAVRIWKGLMLTINETPRKDSEHWTG